MKEPTNAAAAKQLCTDCGFCCSGVLFIDVRIEDKQDLDRVVNCGVELEQHDNQNFLIQPCHCLDERSHCKIYDKRPNMCASFECGVLKHLKTGDWSFSKCKKTVQEAQVHVSSLTNTLLKLGNLDVGVPLFLRTEEVLSQPWDLDGPDSVLELRDQLFQQSADLSSFLETHFLSEEEAQEREES